MTTALQKIRAAGFTRRLFPVSSRGGNVTGRVHCQPRREATKLHGLLGLAFSLATALLLGALRGLLASALFLGSLLCRLLLGGSSLLGHSYSSIKRLR